MQEFKVNEYITLKLEDGRTNIYTNGKLFRHCKYVLMRKTVYELENLLDEIESVDEMVSHLDHSLQAIEPELIDIPSKTLFWVHCSNLQVWAENNYDTRMLHSNLAFPLLRKLSELNDPKAKRVFKEEIAERIASGYPSVIGFLVNKFYLDYLDTEEIDSLFEDFDFTLIIKKNPRILITLYKNFVRLGALNAKKIILQEISDRFFDDNPLTMDLLLELDSQFFDLIEQEKEWFLSQFQPSKMGKNFKEIYKTKFFYNFKYGDYSIVNRLIHSNYLYTLNRGEINSLFEDFDYEQIIKKDKYAPSTFERLIRLKAPNARKFYRDYVFEIFNSGDNSKILFLLRHGYLRYQSKEDINVFLNKIDYEYILEQDDVFNIFKLLKYLKAPNIDKWHKQYIAKLIKTGSEFYKIAEGIIYGLIDEYSKEYIDELFKGYDYAHIVEQHFDIAPIFLEKLVKLGLLEAKKIYESEDFLKKNLIDDEIPFLLELYSMLDSPIRMHRPKIDWRTDALWPPGITIENKRIVDLNLKGCNLNEIPESVGKLTQLKKMNLSKSRLNSLPSSMNNLKLLKELDLSHNQFVEFPSVISQLNSLEKLRLNGNSIEDVPDTISELNSLLLLDLRRNNLKILPKTISSLKKLVYLGLSFNNLDSIPENINELESLEMLFCDYNNLKVLPETIGNLMKLNYLDLDGNPLISLPKSILGINSLRTLSVNLKHLNESEYSILNLLSDNNVNVCSPPYTIDFDFYDDESCFSPKDKNTQRKFSRYISPERLPLTSGIVDKLNGMYSTVYGGKEGFTPELCTTILEIFEEIKDQLQPDFRVILDKDLKMKLLEQVKLDHDSV